MLAKIEDHIQPVAVTLPQDYDGYPLWHPLFTQPGREEKAADLLEQVAIRPYVPSFHRLMPTRVKGVRRWRKQMVLPGMLFVPDLFLATPRRDELLDFARVRWAMRPMSKAEIEAIRRIEAKLNLPPEAKGVFFKRGQKVRFVDGAFVGFVGPVMEIASERRIRVEIDVFGRATPIWTPADEIEAI